MAREYYTHPIKVNGQFLTEMTEGELGKLYENTDFNWVFDR